MKTFTSQCNYKGRIVGLLFIFLILGSQSAFAQWNKKYIMGPVMNSVTGAPIMGVEVDFYSMDGKKVLSKKTGRSKHNEVVYSSYMVVLPEGTYRVRFSHSDYETVEQEIKVKFHKREQYLYMPVVKLKRKPREQVLQAATVKATKVKFYTKKDTLVFNADAFTTAEGSMLNVLIRQLPGVELKDDGRILVNGRYVESLLLNGDDFFQSDRSIMLENLPSYMVKNIKVYERESDEMLRMMKRESGRKQLVMDVNLKKQYSIGWIANTEWGGGTEKRYLGRLFALRFTPQSRVTLVGNMNNVNDSRKPGETGSWTPEQMSSGALATKMAALDYRVIDRLGKFQIYGNAKINHADADNLTTTNQVNFLQGGNTYERSQSLTNSRDTRIDTWHQLTIPFGQDKFRESTGGALQIAPYFRYRRYKNTGGSVNGTFSDDPSKYVSAGLIDSLRGPLAGSLIRQHLVNRSLSQTLNEGHRVSAGGSSSYYYAIPHTQDMLDFEFSGDYTEQEDQLFGQRQYDYFQSTSASTDYRNQYYNRPGHSYNYSGSINYAYKPGGFMNVINARYKFTRQYASNQRELYRLDWMTDGEWGIGTENPIGTLPSVTDWEEQTLDAANSFYSGQHSYEHKWQIDGFFRKFTENNYWEFDFDVPFRYVTKKLAYQTGSGIYRPTRSEFLPAVNVDVAYATQETRYRYELKYNLSSSMPELRNLIDIKDDSNPLWVSYGNPSLKNSYTHEIGGKYILVNEDKERQFHLSGTYATTRNAISRAYAYDRETGIRSSRPENINGNYQVAGDAGFSTPLDKQKRWTLQSNADVTYLHSVDLTDTGDGLNPRSVVKSVFSTGDVRVDYQLEKYKVGARVKGTWGHATSNRADFELINTGDLTYGLTAQVKLPWDIQFNTDLNLYSRYGYNDPSMNTNDLVWNARVSKTFMKGTVTVLLDGFDILRNLSNVTRTLNAQGRTEVYRNVIPSYFMLHAIYRLNIKPKKRPGDE